MEMGFCVFEKGVLFIKKVAFVEMGLLSIPEVKYGIENRDFLQTP